MQKSFSLDLLFYRFKNSPFFGAAVFFVLILISAMLVITFVIPQVQQWLILQGEISAVKQRINVLETNLQTINSLNMEELDADFETVINTYPTDKDFEGVLNAISSAVVESAVSLDDYEFTIGPLATESASLTDEIPLQIRLMILSDAEGVYRFLQSMKEKVPLSAVYTIRTDTASAASTEVVVEYYFKEFPQITADGVHQITPITQEDRELIQIFAGWKLQSSLLVFPIDTATGSASFLPGPLE